jgi:hypothetical protein
LVRAVRFRTPLSRIRTLGAEIHPYCPANGGFLRLIARWAYDCGRIINPKTARSQAISGITWGVGQAVLEQSETDPAMGRFLNRN